MLLVPNQSGIYYPATERGPPQLFGLRDPRKEKHGSRMQWTILDRVCKLVIGLVPC
jgi:hypothetical protein